MPTTVQLRAWQRSLDSLLDARMEVVRACFEYVLGTIEKPQGHNPATGT